MTEDSLILNTKEVQRGASPVIVDPVSNTNAVKCWHSSFFSFNISLNRMQKIGGCLLNEKPNANHEEQWKFHWNDEGLVLDIFRCI